MTREKIIAELKQFFRIEELVCKHIYNKFGEKSWQFLRTEALHALLVIRRDILKVPLYCNNWKRGGELSQRGYRCNICDIVADKTQKNILYASGHPNGCAFDLTSPRMTAAQMRQQIEANKDMLPYSIRMEDDVTWLHFDMYANSNNKISYFKP